MEYTGPSEKRIQNDKLSFEIHFFQGFSPRKIVELRKKLALKTAFNFKENWTIYLDFNHK